MGIGLAMDAFAVSICQGLSMSHINWKRALVIAFFFGAFQAIMPLIGWALGTSFAELIEPVDHWVAFVLLAFVGAKMLWDGVHEDDEYDDCAPDSEKLDMRELLMLSVATSIDALAVGISFAMLSVNIWVAIVVIGVVTFVLSLIGVGIGNAFGAHFRKPATIVGGIILILIGVKIVLEHLGLLA